MGSRVSVRPGSWVSGWTDTVGSLKVSLVGQGLSDIARRHLEAAGKILTVVTREAEVLFDDVKAKWPVGVRGARTGGRDVGTGEKITRFTSKTVPHSRDALNFEVALTEKGIIAAIVSPAPYTFFIKARKFAGKNPWQVLVRKQSKELTKRLVEELGPELRRFGKS